jgi:choline dehydrogenase
MAGLVHCMNSIHKGFRSSIYVFVEGKPNITILSSTHSKKLLFDGTTVTGVEVLSLDGQELTFYANYEVIVSSGVFESPKLLMLSGVGPEEILKEHNIESVLKSAHVGKNLLHHPIITHVFRLKDGLGLDGHLLRAGPAKADAVAVYQKDQSGPLGGGLLGLVGFPRIDERLLKSKEYVTVQAENGGKDPFGPGGQPHFDIDFVVCNLSS